MRGGRFLWRTTRRWRGALLVFSGLAAASSLFLVCYLHATSLKPLSQALSPLLFSATNSKCYDRKRVDVARRPKSSAGAKQSSTFIDTAEVYPQLDFTPRYITFWNRTFEERYLRTREKWKDLPLEVIIVPHSHNDPGWLLTFDGYYEQFTTKILDNMVTFLNKTPDFPFVWSEISLFAKWWEKTSSETRTTVKRLLDQHQLEIVTGGWVMTDEATSHYYAMIDQMIEGHQWLKTTTGTIPTHGWSVDIFGHSSTMPYLLSSVNISDTVVLRIHYAWKTFLAERRQLDFYWEQKFDSHRVLCHVAPSDLYSIKHTCGPDPQACLQFDFRRIRNEFSETLATDITNENVRPKAERLLAQYGRYGSLFPHNVLLVPLGDDFRYNYYLEWEQQYENYLKLFRYINNKTELNAHISFGTVRDYFTKVRSRLNKIQPETLPSVKGDFFPYADTYADGNPSYWTGYYTTRPFWKRLARELQSWLRVAEILFTLCHSTATTAIKEKLHKDYSYLVASRQQLALFQHHDAITGTSKERVMRDYGMRLHEAIRETLGIISHTSQHLLMPSSSENNVWTSKMNPDAVRPDPESPTKKLILSIPTKGRKIILHNSMAQRKQEPVKVKVNYPLVIVLDEHGNKIPSQVNPVWDEWLGISKSAFELVFICKVEPLSFTTYTILRVDENEVRKSEISLQMADSFRDNMPQNSAFTFTCPNRKAIVLQNSYLTAKFASSGQLQEVTLNEKIFQQKIQLKLYTYESTPFRSGGYLFRPVQNVYIPLDNFTDHLTLVRVVQGPVVSEVTLIYHELLILTTRIYHSEQIPGGFEIEALFDLATVTQNMELVMELNTDINSNDVFYTDSNGLQITKRKHASRIPIQGNYYPATSATYIEDEYSRLTVLLSHSQGVTSTRSGCLEIMLDRRLYQDDGRGMGEGILDNKLTAANFWILPEYLEYTRQEDPSLSAAGHVLSETLLFPIVTLFVDSASEDIPPAMSFMSQPWPTDIHLVNLRTLPSPQNFSLPFDNALLIVHRKDISCKIKTRNEGLSEGVMQINVLRNNTVKSIDSVTLSGTIVLDKDVEFSEKDMLPGTLKSYKLNYR